MDTRFITPFPPELDIVVWAPRAARVSEASALAQRIFAAAEQRHLYLALASLPTAMFDLPAAGMEADSETITCLRSVLMKPEHLDWLDRIWPLLDQAVASVIGDH
jgi:hypothetical protein